MSLERSRSIPTIESNIFIGHQESRFALGKIAINNVVLNGYENEFNGAAQLRASTYLDKGFIGVEDLDANGTELDDNDYSRSVHFVMLERVEEDSSRACVVGNMRLIVKTQEDSTPLPLEGYRKDFFDENPIPIGGVEVSRLISLHENAYIQNSLKWPLFVAGQKYVDGHNLESVYGLTSPALTRLLKIQHIPISAMADAKYIEEINATKQPIRIDMAALKRLVKVVGDQGIDVMKDDFSYINISNVKKDKKQKLL